MGFISYSLKYYIDELEKIESTKTLLDGYNTNNEYAALDKVMTNLIKLCNTVNSDINSENYENFKTYQNQLRGIYSSFARWMAQGEL